MNRICELFNIQYPIIQGGMIWCSGWELASAVSNAGGLGLIGSGSMKPDVIQEQIRKCKAATDKPFGINVPLLFHGNEDLFKMLIAEGVKIVFTSAGNPAKWTPFLKEKGLTVVHVVANVKSALKCEESGVDAIVAEGFEAGGHNGREETTTMVLIPIIEKQIKIPLIAAGGIATGRGMLAAFALGAEGVQIGSRFVATTESSAHENFKKSILETGDGGTMLSMKKLMPVRLIKNKFFNDVEYIENTGASSEQISELLGKGRSRRGMFEGELDEGELEIGQIAAIINTIKPAAKVIEEIMHEYNFAKKELSKISF
ncbi:MAG: nitronate monooxygenase [Bacteroidetes bacterium]|nr:nitronate monooxygenase [Bacteroidota bacterium]